MTEFVATVANIHKLVHGRHDLLITDIALFRGDTDKNHHSEKFSIPVSVLNESSWKCSVYFYLDFTALMPENHLLYDVTVHVLHRLWRGKGLTQSSVYILRCFAMWNFAKWIHCWYSTKAAVPFPLQKLYTKCISVYSSFVNMLSILIMTILQHNMATLV
jgi:hypothetical protein